MQVFSVLLRKARLMGFACPDGAGIGVVGKFTGATVLEARKGAYFDVVSCLDYASLYPSIIRSRSLDYSTIVLDPRYANVPGVEYYEVDTDQGSFKFAQGVPAVLPALLEDLAQFRKAAKKKMAAAKARGDAFATAIHNGAQNAFKVTMNRWAGGRRASAENTNPFAFHQYLCTIVPCAVHTGSAALPRATCRASPSRPA